MATRLAEPVKPPRYVYDVTVTNDREWLGPEAKVPTGSIRIELGGVAEISEDLGVPRQRISMWSARRATSGFPMPVASLAAGPVYDMAAVRAWYEEKYGDRP